jgi:hypothetical protein
MTIERVELKHFFLYILTIYLEGLSSAHPVREGASRGVLRWSWDCGVYGREETFPRALGRPWVAVRAHYRL